MSRSPNVPVPAADSEADSEAESAGRPRVDDASVQSSADAARSGPVAAYLAGLHARHVGLTAGAVADFVPQLASADPARFGISVVMLSGQVYEAGDTRAPFTIQSIAKPLAFALALEQHGDAIVRTRVGVEPTGDPFNATSLDADGRPLNPMVNAGAIAVAGLLAAADEDPTGLAAEEGPVVAARFLAAVGHYAGRELTLDHEVLAAESASAHRNRALAHLMRGSGAVRVDPEAALQAYLAECAVQVDCRDLAVIAATLANDGVNPVTGQRVASSGTVRRVLSVMATCGMYDGAGDWMYTVGLPAKSGVSGGLIAVLPGQLGVGVYSPRLDEHGNSVRAVQVCRDLSRELDLHLLAAGPPATTVIDATEEAGGAVVVLRLHGDLGITGVEAVTRRLAADEVRFAVLDVSRVQRPRYRVLGLFLDVRRELLARGGDVVLVGRDVHPDLVAAFEAVALERQVDPRAVTVHPDRPTAVAWCAAQVGGAGAADGGASG